MLPAAADDDDDHRLERCANTGEIGKALGEILYAAGPYEKEFSEAQLTEMFEYIKEKAEELAAILGLGNEIDNLLHSAVENRAMGYRSPVAAMRLHRAADPFWPVRVGPRISSSANR